MKKVLLTSAGALVLVSASVAGTYFFITQAPIGAGANQGTPQSEEARRGLPGDWLLAGSEEFSNEPLRITLRETADNKVAGIAKWQFDNFTLGDTLTYKNQDENVMGYHYGETLDLNIEFMGESRARIVPETIFAQYRLQLSRVDEDRYEGKVEVTHQNISHRRTSKFEDAVRLTRAN